MRTIGIGVVIIKDHKILVGIRGRECSQGAGMWALPGGKLEDSEPVETAIVREIGEECGLTITFGSRVFETPIFAVTDHYPIPHLSFWALAYWVSGEPVVKEPAKCERWEWKTLSDISQIPGVHNPNEKAYYWLPMPLLKRHLLPIINKK